MASQLQIWSMGVPALGAIVGSIMGGGGDAASTAIKSLVDFADKLLKEQLDGTPEEKEQQQRADELMKTHPAFITAIANLERRGLMSNADEEVQHG